MVSFEEHDRLFPALWAAFERDALRLWAQGRRRYGAKKIVQDLRQNAGVKLSNNHAADYARKFLAQHPEKHELFALHARRDPLQPVRVRKRPLNFHRYDRENPQVWKAYVGVAFLVIGRGITQSASKTIVEELRWNTGVGAANEPYKLCNSFTADYARKFCREFPMWAHLFVLRQTRTPRTQPPKPRHRASQPRKKAEPVGIAFLF